MLCTKVVIAASGSWQTSKGEFTLGDYMILETHRATAYIRLTEDHIFQIMEREIYQSDEEAIEIPVEELETPLYSMVVSKSGNIKMMIKDDQKRIAANIVDFQWSLVASEGRARLKLVVVKVPMNGPSDKFFLIQRKVN